MSRLSILQLDSRNDGFYENLQSLLDRSHEQVEGVESVVEGIIDDIRRRGDEALLEYTRRFDRVDVTAAGMLELTPQRLQQALDNIPGDQRAALEVSIKRVREFHQRQGSESWTYTDDTGTLLGQKVTPLDRVGIYVPGGKAAYPSTVVMTAVPAHVAGVGEIIMVVPTPGGETNDLVLAAAGIHDWWCAGYCCTGLWNRNSPRRRQDRWPGQCLRGDGETPSFRQGRHRYGRRSIRNRCAV